MSSSRLAGLGIFVLGGLLLFTLGLFLIGDRRLLFAEHFEVYTEFKKVTGLQNGAIVQVGGKQAGEVLQIEVPPQPERPFKVKMRILEELHPLVRTDSVATIQTEGLLGNKFLQVDPGTSSAPKAPPNSILPSREPFEFVDLMEQASATIQTINDVTRRLTDELEKTISVTTDTIQDVNRLLNDAGGDVRSITVSSRQIAADLSAITESARSGKGTVGKLLTDDALYRNVVETSEGARQVLANLQEASAKLKTAAGQIQLSDPKTGQNLVTDLRFAVSNAREVMSDLAENTEAMKRNWLLRRFFTGRNYFDLDNISLAAYQKGVLHSEHRATKRIWIYAHELFPTSDSGEVTLGASGEARIDAAMAELVQYPLNEILMIEGYCGKGTADRQYLISKRRAAVVKDYLVRKYELDPKRIGTMPMKSVMADDGSPWEGVALVLFYDKSVKKEDERIAEKNK